eukprot:jgi/Chlat1/4824/Chrsp31S04802
MPAAATPRSSPASWALGTPKAASTPRSVSFTSFKSIDNDADASGDAYLSELLSYSLERLNKEPELLRADGERLARQMQDVAVGHYRAFIAAADCTRRTCAEIQAIDQHLQSLLDNLPALVSGCEMFVSDAEQILAQRKSNRTTLTHHATLLDLLEIPQLTDTCVRNGNYDEALDLEALVSKLATMHAKLPVIQSLAKDVRITMQAMLQQLLQRLRSNIQARCACQTVHHVSMARKYVILLVIMQLPECLRVIGYLRRLGVYSEHEMRLQFLRCREAYLTDVIADLDRHSSYDYLKRLTDVHRVHLFDVVMQYRAIFADDTSAQEQLAQKDSGMLYSWATHRLCAYVETLREMLPTISEGGSLASVLEHCMYCGLSLGRVGLDFRGILPSLFENCAYEIFKRNITAAMDAFQQALDSYRWVPLPSMAPSGRAASHSNDDHVTPPYSLMEYPPVATFINGVLAAYNELRHCAPTAKRGPVTKLLHDALTSVADTLSRYHATRSLRESESGLFLALVRAVLEAKVEVEVEVATPYLIMCFGRIYPGHGAQVDLQNTMKPLRDIVAASAPPVEVGDGETTDDKASQSSSVAPQGSDTARDGDGSLQKPQTAEHTTASGAQLEGFADLGADASQGQSLASTETPSDGTASVGQVATTSLSQRTNDSDN